MKRIISVTKNWPSSPSVLTVKLSDLGSYDINIDDVPSTKTLLLISQEAAADFTVSESEIKWGDGTILSADDVLKFGHYSKMQTGGYGYHTRSIPKGELGKFSKIQEEFLELSDAEQDNPILEMCELADLLGAVEAYTKSRWNLSLDDVRKMTDATRKAFVDGAR